MRVLVTSPAGIGHIHPLLPLANAFVARGHEVRFATSPDMCPAVERAGLTAHPAGLPGGARHRAVMERWGAEIAALPPPERPPFMFPRMFGLVGMPPMLADLRALVADWRPDLVVNDAGELAGPLLATQLGVAHATHSFGTVLLDRFQGAGDLTTDLWTDAGLEQPPFAGLCSDVYVEIRPPSIAEDVPAQTLLRERPMAMDALGGDLPQLVTDADPRPLVYLTLGTVFSDPAVLRTAVEGIAQLPVRLLVTTGPNGDPDAVGATPDNALVTRYVPQTQLLAHCAVVVSHAGSGTFLGSLAEGIPQVCVPQAADQFLNAADGARVGAALTLLPDAVTPESLRDAVTEVLDTPSYREKAQELAAEIAAMPSPDDVAVALEDHVGG